MRGKERAGEGETNRRGERDLLTYDQLYASSTDNYPLLPRDEQGIKTLKGKH